MGAISLESCSICLQAMGRFICESRPLPIRKSWIWCSWVSPAEWYPARNHCLSCSMPIRVDPVFHALTLHFNFLHGLFSVSSSALVPILCSVRPFLHRYAVHSMFQMHRDGKGSLYLHLDNSGILLFCHLCIWVLHRLHHAHTDTEDDPHSPKF